MFFLRVHGADGCEIIGGMGMVMVRFDSAGGGIARNDDLLCVRDEDAKPSDVGRTRIATRRNGSAVAFGDDGYHAVRIAECAAGDLVWLESGGEGLGWTLVQVVEKLPPAT